MLASVWPKVVLLAVLAGASVWIFWEPFGYVDGKRFSAGAEKTMLAMESKKTLAPAAEIESMAQVHGSLSGRSGANPDHQDGLAAQSNAAPLPAFVQGSSLPAARFGGPAAETAGHRPDVSAEASQSAIKSVYPVVASDDMAPLPVPPGAQLPALFRDARPLPAPQRRALDRIANEFIDKVVVAGNEKEDALEIENAVEKPLGSPRKEVKDPVEAVASRVWESARASADRQYITLFGHAAYNALHMQTAKEAARERKSVTSAQR